MCQIQNSLLTYYDFSFKRRVYLAWKNIKDTHNRLRIALVRQRAAFRQNPRLARPLMVLKQLLLFKAFNALKTKTRRAHQYKGHEQIWSHAFYLRVVRKSFYGLRLNAAASFQRKKSKEIKHLMIQRRWFRKLRLATQGLQESRKQATDSAIFRFLSL